MHYFLPWYKAASSSETANAWEALRVIRLIILTTALSAILAPGFKAMQEPLPPQATVAGIWLAGTSFLLIVTRVFIDQPGPDRLINVYFGAFIGIFAAAGIIFSFLLSFKNR